MNASDKEKRKQTAGRTERQAGRQAQASNPKQTTPLDSPDLQARNNWRKGRHAGEVWTYNGY